MKYIRWLKQPSLIYITRGLSIPNRSSLEVRKSERHQHQEAEIFEHTEKSRKTNISIKKVEERKMGEGLDCPFICSC